MKTNYLVRAICLVILVVSFLPVSRAGALVSAAPPPADMFQLPWDQGIAWVAIDGLDNGTKRPLNSSHNYQLGGAIDFAPKPKMVTGEDTSQYFVAAAADGTVIATSTCYVTIAHANGWITQYFSIGNIRVKLGDVVTRNQRLGIIADGVRQRYCPGAQEINVPHLHFMLRPSIIGATFAGWEVHYSSLLNWTTFSKGLILVGLNKPLLNVFDTQPTPTATASATSTSTPTPILSPTPTLTGPYVSTSIDPRTIDVGGTALVTVALNNVPAEGYTSAEFTCAYNPGSLEVSNITAASLFGADSVMVVNGPQDHSFIVAIAGSNGNKATSSGTAFTFNVKGLQTGQTNITCQGRVSQGNNVLTEIPYVFDTLTILGSTPTPNVTPSFTPTSTPTNTPAGPASTPTPTNTQVGPTQTATPTPGTDWIAYTNDKFGFRFLYPKEGQILAGATDNYARINLPRVPGTNLSQKYMEVFAGETTGTCQSPEAVNNPMTISETVVINGITFLKQSGQDGFTSHIAKWVAYSTVRNNICVNLDFVLISVNPDVVSTPPPLYDPVLESAMFGQIVGTYIWFDLPTATPTGSATATFTPTPANSPTATSTPTAATSATPTVTSTPGTNGTVTGQITVSKPVTLSIYDASMNLVATTESADGNFSLNVPPGTYTIVASAPGFLSAQRAITLTTGTTTPLPSIALLAGDINGNNIIDQFDALTIGMGYNSTAPDAADLNDDGIINVLDLEALAKNYRKTGPVAW